MNTMVLNDGTVIPTVGFGGLSDPQTTAPPTGAVRQALEIGYRHIDTAAYYRNEASVGQALRASGLPREAVFLTSKVWNTDRGYAPTKAAFQATLDRLGTDYLDLYLIHWPAAANQFDDWEAINRAHLAGHDGALPGGVRSGPSACATSCRTACWIYATTPRFTTDRTRSSVIPTTSGRRNCPLMKELNVQRRHGTLREGLKGMFTEPVLLEIARKHSKSRPRSSSAGTYSRASS